VCTSVSDEEVELVVTVVWEVDVTEVGLQFKLILRTGERRLVQFEGDNPLVL